MALNIPHTVRYALQTCILILCQVALQNTADNIIHLFKSDITRLCEKIIKKLADFSSVKSKSFLCHCCSPGASTWTTERRRKCTEMRAGEEEEVHIYANGNYRSPVNIWSQRGNKIFSFTCKSSAILNTLLLRCKAFHPLHTRKIGRHHLNSRSGCECSLSLKALRLFFEHEYIM